MDKSFIVETSARHVHLTEEHIEILFGKGARLTHKKDLSQPGQFACEERVTVVGPKKELANVIILGPARPASQVELSLTDARTIGLSAPVRESGDIAGSPGCTIIGPCGAGHAGARGDRGQAARTYDPGGRAATGGER